MKTNRTNKILWMDDDFVTVLQDQNFVQKDESIRKTMEDFLFGFMQSEVNNNYPQIELIPVTNVDDFKKHFDDSVVLSILDVKGCMNVDEMRLPDTEAYYSVANFLIKKSIRKVIIFSGNIDEGDTAFDLNKSFGVNGWGVVSKKENDVCNVLKEKVLKELKDYEFIHYSYIPGLYREGVFLDSDLNILTEIVQSYQNKDFSHTYLNAMRTTLESLMNHFINIFDKDTIQHVDERLTNSTSNSYNNIKYLICSKVKFRDKKPDFTNPYVPYDVCPLEVKHALNYLWEFVNVASHRREFSEEYQKLFQENVKKRHLVMTYEAFFLVLEWFYIFFTDEKSKKDAEESFMKP